MLISLLKSEATAEASTREVTLSELESLLTDYRPASSKRGQPCWSPILWRGEKRAAANAVSVGALVFDLDHTDPKDLSSPAPTQEQVDQVASRIDELGCAAFLLETRTAGHWRVVIPLATPIPPAEYFDVYRNVGEYLRAPYDPSCADLARVFYLPSIPQAGDQRATAVSDGPLLSWTQFRNAPPSPVPVEEPPLDMDEVRKHLLANAGALQTTVEKLLEGKLLLLEGGRDQALTKLAGLFARLFRLVPPAAVYTLMEPALAALRPDEGTRDWRASFRSKYERFVEREKEKNVLDNAEILQMLQGDDFIYAMNKDGSKSLVPHTSNIEKILRHDPELKGTIRWNELRKSIEVTEGPFADLHVDVLGVHITNWLFTNTRYRMKAQRADVEVTLLALAMQNKYNPVVNYLNALTWDGNPRIDTALTDYAQVEDEELTRAYSSKFFIGAVARVFNPGCQMDTALVLSGEQGVGKTSFFRVLAGEYHVESRLDIHNKDAVMVATGGWVVELAEMASVRRGDVESVRSFLSTTVDQLRVPYGRGVSAFPRRNVFVGTTNSDTPLIDAEGNRRFWVVHVPAPVRLQALALERDQLWAEAVTRFRAGEAWWLDARLSKAHAISAEQFRFKGAIDLRIAEYVSNKLTKGEPLPVKGALWWCDTVLGLPSPTNPELTAIKAALKRHGFEERRPGGKSRVWVHPAVRVDAEGQERLVQ